MRINRTPIKNQLKKLILVFDATAKPPSGILSGNVVQYGDFDECLSVENAQYCLAEIDFRNVWKEPYLNFQNQVHSYFVFKEEFDDVSVPIVLIKSIVFE